MLIIHSRRHAAMTDRADSAAIAPGSSADAQMASLKRESRALDVTDGYHSPSTAAQPHKMSSKRPRPTQHIETVKAERTDKWCTKVQPYRPTATRYLHRQNLPPQLPQPTGNVGTGTRHTPSSDPSRHHALLRHNLQGRPRLVARAHLWKASRSVFAGEE